jgi:hypothetical protein
MQSLPNIKHTASPIRRSICGMPRNSVRTASLRAEVWQQTGVPQPDNDAQYRHLILSVYNILWPWVWSFSLEQYLVTTATNCLSSVKTLYERTLCSRSRTSRQSLYSVYRVYSVNIRNISCWYVKCIVLYKRGGLWLSTYTCYSLETALLVDVHEPFSDMNEDWRRTETEGGEVNITNYDIPR